MEELTVDLSQGDENELTFMEKGVGDLHFLRFNHLVIEKKEIKVDGPRAPPKRLDSSQFRFDLLHGAKKIRGIEFRFYLDDAVHEPILIEIAQRLSLVKGRSSKKPVAINAEDFTNSLFALINFVAEVGTEADVGDMSHLN